jgi:hypothetical protein
MDGRKEIPDETKWKIASRLAAALPLMYDYAFREVVGEKYDEIERDIWVEVGKEVKLVADAFRLPVKTAGEVADAVQTVATIFFGPDWQRERNMIADDRAVIVTKRCPFRIKEMELRQRPDLHFQKCLAFSVIAVESLNKNYTLRFIRSMCMGDKHCEMKIVLKETIKEEPEQLGDAGMKG